MKINCSLQPRSNAILTFFKTPVLHHHELQELHQYYGNILLMCLSITNCSLKQTFHDWSAKFLKWEGGLPLTKPTNWRWSVNISAPAIHNRRQFFVSAVRCEEVLASTGQHWVWLCCSDQLDREMKRQSGKCVTSVSKPAPALSYERAHNDVN